MNLERNILFKAITTIYAVNISITSEFPLTIFIILIFFLMNTIVQLKFAKRLCQRRQWHPTSVLLPEKSHGRRSLLVCSPWVAKELDTTERLHFQFSLSCIGEGNGNPLQCSWLENPRDGGVWWAAVYGVAQRWTRLKWLSSSSSSSSKRICLMLSILFTKITRKYHTFICWLQSLNCFTEWPT